MSNRRLRSIYGPSLSIHDLRRMALGESIAIWCDTVEPQLRQEWDTLAKQSAAMILEMDADMQRLSIMHCDTPEDWERRSAEMQRLQEMQDRQTAILERRARTYGQLSAGGAASIWAGMQRGQAKRQAEDQPSERPVKPFRKFGDVHKLQGQSAQPVEAEVVESDAAEG